MATSKTASNKGNKKVSDRGGLDQARSGRPSGKASASAKGKAAKGGAQKAAGAKKGRNRNTGSA